ncbi:hypothetical protein C8J57DRAFT_1226973 [Mycena rebaudengoi]|nr:hypothetical protein C8J57DRAFT_1226973 [Mycena rebaudengoi]
MNFERRHRAAPLLQLKAINDPSHVQTRAKFRRCATRNTAAIIVIVVNANIYKVVCFSGGFSVCGGETYFESKGRPWHPVVLGRAKDDRRLLAGSLCFVFRPYNTAMHVKK